MLFFYGPNKLDFAASVYAKERNIIHLAHLGSQGWGEGPEPSLANRVIISLTGHAEVKYRERGEKKGRSHVCW